MTQGAAGFVMRRRLLQGLEGVGDAAFPLVDAGEVDPAVGLAQVGHLLEDRLGLLQLALLAPLVAPFEQQADAVVVPALPGVVLGIGDGSFAAVGPPSTGSWTRSRAMTTTGSSGPSPCRR